MKVWKWIQYLWMVAFTLGLLALAVYLNKGDQ